MDVGVLFDHLDSVERRERPLTPIRPYLKRDRRYVETDETCIDDDCNGSLWEGPDDKVCGRCSAVKDSTSEPRTVEDLWGDFHADRPRYPNSNKRRQVGAFRNDWVESSDVDGPVTDIEPTLFYRPEDV